MECGGRLERLARHHGDGRNEFLESSVNSIHRRFTTLCVMVTALFGVLFVGLMLLAAFTVCAREQPMRPAGSVIKSLDGSQQQFEYAPEIEGRTSSMQVVLAPQRFVYW